MNAEHRDRSAMAEQVHEYVDMTIQGQSLPLSEILRQYLLTGVAPAPLNSQFEFSSDLDDSQLDSLDGHRLDHDLSEIDRCNDVLSVIHQNMQTNVSHNVNKPSEPSIPEPSQEPAS